MTAHLLVIAKQPQAGRSKTRLSPALSPLDAARVAEASLLDTLDSCLAADVTHRTLVLEGSPDGWVPDGLAVVPQVSGSLGDRLEAAFASAFATHDVPTLLVGMDTPQVTPAELEQALAPLLAGTADATLGLAADGGWWALGLRRAAPAAFDGVPMSADDTGTHQRARLEALGLRVEGLPVLRDIDHVEDLHEVLTRMPASSRLARLAPLLVAA